MEMGGAARVTPAIHSDRASPLQSGSGQPASCSPALRHLPARRRDPKVFKLIESDPFSPSVFANRTDPAEADDRIAEPDFVGSSEVAELEITGFGNEARATKVFQQPLPHHPRQTKIWSNRGSHRIASQNPKVGNRGFEKSVH